ncbi:MAG: hypothetical protein RMK99_02140 [Anaerolineales bacterium]|nr:hypothetical protein [Anaerolineales bacterium]
MRITLTEIPDLLIGILSSMFGQIQLATGDKPGWIWITAERSRSRRTAVVEPVDDRQPAVTASPGTLWV